MRASPFNLYYPFISLTSHGYYYHNHYYYYYITIIIITMYNKHVYMKYDNMYIHYIDIDIYASLLHS